MPNLDATDHQILALLQDNAKLNVNDIAQELNLTKTPIYERIKRLEKTGVIDKYVALVDRKKFTPSVVVFLTGSLKVTKFDQTQDFYDAVMKIDEVLECYLLGGEKDFMLKVIARDLDSYHEFYSAKIGSIPYVGEIKSSFVLKEVKYSTRIPNMNLMD
ncbi:Lrp/AsnC family transcriptional regulator [Fulvivirga sp. RKSG066]|uniref:Lrp/AsnC family transcriptional regulator n=1 Tax=Fulvivirga aurantia TaxID=2529383 RepID=UPI0012BD52AF|nr:Lrp/AsnC family transcriptional regulator [Fulvivirga aurantia]MTI21828.1 Lrp/AsnC family transcriptional regulator [Fulvivirga aurantia]